MCSVEIHSLRRMTHITPIFKSLHWLKVNERIEYKLLSHLQSSSQPLNLAIFTTLSLFNLLAMPDPHLLSLFLARQPSSPWKSQVAHLDMHYVVFVINFQDSFRQPHQSCRDSPPHPFVNPSLLSSPLSSSITPSLSLKVQYLPFQQILPT